MTPVDEAKRLANGWGPRQGRHIEAARMRSLMARRQLAERLGVTEESIRRWEHGGSRPSPELLARLIAVLAIDQAFLSALSSLPEELPDLARLLSHERSHRGITQLEAAKLLGVAQATYAGWEIGRSAPGIASLQPVARFLGLSLREVQALVVLPFEVNTTNWPPLGKVIGGQRAALRLTRESLAKRLGVATSTVVAWELGHRSPRAGQLHALSATLQVPVAVLVEALPLAELSVLGQLVRLRAAHLGLKLGEIASRIGVDESTLSRWLHGHRTPALSSLSRLAVALELPFPDVRAAAGLGF